MSFAKQTTYRSERWLRAVASLECVICGSPNVQAAHRNEGKGMAMKTDDCLTAALCQAHHADIDIGTLLTREQRRADMDRAIVLTLQQLVKRGLVGPR